MGLRERLRKQKPLTLGTECLPSRNSTAIEISWLLKGRGDVAGLSLSLASPASHHVRDTFSAVAPSCIFTHFTFPKLSKVKDCCRSSVPHPRIQPMVDRKQGESMGMKGRLHVLLYKGLGQPQKQSPTDTEGRLYFPLPPMRKRGHREVK